MASRCKRGNTCGCGPMRSSATLFAGFLNASRYGAPRNAPVAQLDRASDFESEGREFESLRARHFRPVRSETWVTDYSGRLVTGPARTGCSSIRIIAGSTGASRDRAANRVPMTWRPAGLAGALVASAFARFLIGAITVLRDEISGVTFDLFGHRARCSGSSREAR